MRNTSWLRTAIASLAICAIGGALLWSGTAGFRAFTSEQARRRAIAERPRVLPVVDLEDQDGRPFRLTAYHGRPLAVDFVYTQCVSVCTLLSAGFQRLDRAERSRFESEKERLQLVSISFDPRDTPNRLREYASRYQADGRTWRFARVRDARDLSRILRSFGIVVIPDGRGDFQHNAAVHVVNGDGRLARVLDLSADPADIARGRRERPMRRAFAGAILVAVLALPEPRYALERVMIVHMLVQIPLLALAGGLAATALSSQWRTRVAAWNAHGISGMLMALIASSWWMVPRALDWALASPAMETTKFITLPLLVGAPIALSWSRLGGMGRAFVIANVLPMWAVVGWLYVAAPVRVCNFYLVEQQLVAGAGLLVVSIALALLAGLLAFRPQ